MSVLIKHMAMPKGCIYANDKDQTEYCPLLNHDDVPFCQYIENEPEIAIGIDERPVYCPLSDVSEPCQDTVSRQDAIDALDEIESEVADGYGYQYEKWRKYFCELPPVQPERKNDDLILAKGSKGEWILVKGSNGKDYHKCSECLHTQEITGVKNYCAVCGVEMVGKQNE
mgnify:CR=1 FL=1